MRRRVFAMKERRQENTRSTECFGSGPVAVVKTWWNAAFVVVYTHRGPKCESQQGRRHSSRVALGGLTSSRNLLDKTVLKKACSGQDFEMMMRIEGRKQCRRAVGRNETLRNEVGLADRCRGQGRGEAWAGVSCLSVFVCTAAGCGGFRWQLAGQGTRRGGSWRSRMIFNTKKKSKNKTKAREEACWREKRRKKGFDVK